MKKRLPLYVPPDVRSYLWHKNFCVITAVAALAVVKVVTVAKKFPPASSCPNSLIVKLLVELNFAIAGAPYGEFPSFGLSIIRFNPPDGRRYRTEHVIAVCGKRIFDGAANNNNGGWVSRLQWETTVLPRIVDGFPAKRRPIGYSITRSFELMPRRQ